MEPIQIISTIILVTIIFSVPFSILKKFQKVNPEKCDLNERTMFGRLKYIKCKHCASGIMISKRTAKHNQFVALFLIVIGFLLCISMVYAIIGIPLFIVGLIFAGGTTNHWVCQECGSRIEKN